MPLTSAIASTLGLALLAVTAGGRLFPATVARASAALDRWRCGLLLKHCRVGALDIPYLEGGSGEPLLLLHGFGGQKENFSHAAAVLRRHYRVFLPDLPGFGAASRDPAADYHVEAQAERMLAFADALGLRRFHLGGNSMGGFIAVECAARHPDRVASLWLISPAGLPGPDETDVVRRFRETGEWPLLVRTRADFDRMLHAVMAHPPFLPHAVRQVLARRGAADHALHRRIARQALLESPRLDARGRALATPALIVWGSEDRVLSPSAAARFRALLPHSELRVMQGVGHASMTEAPQACANDYLRFREGLGAWAEGDLQPAAGRT